MKIIRTVFTRFIAWRRRGGPSPAEIRQRDEAQAFLARMLEAHRWRRERDEYLERRRQWRDRYE